MLAQGYAANPAALRGLQQRLSFSHRDASRACLVSERTWRLWRATGNPNPCAVRLLAILAGYLPWDGWQGWEMHRGVLFPPGYSRRGIEPGEFFALGFYRQLVGEQRRRIAELEARVASLDGAGVARVPAAR